MQENNNTAVEQAALEARREYLNSYRKNNPDKVKKWAHDYWVRKAQRMQQEREAEQTRVEA